MKKALIIGGGFAGCAAAHQLTLKNDGWDITIVEKQAFLGAGVRTSFYGGHPYTFGPRHFLTHKDHIFDFLNQYLPMRKCDDHQFITYVESDDEFYNFPIHVDDIPRMPESGQIQAEISQRNLDAVKDAKNLEEYWVRSVGVTLYDKMVNGYTKKMWQVADNKDIDDFGWSPKGVALKEGPREAWDKAISAYPIALDGYNKYFEIATQGVNVRLNSEIQRYDIEHKKVYINDAWESYDIIINTISPDLLFEQCFGELPYMGRDFFPILLPVEEVFPKGVYFVYYAGAEKFTRIVEYKKLSRYKSKNTLIGLEIPSKNGKHYPMPFKSEYARADRYFSLMPPDVYSIGRAGKYRYQVDIDDGIEQAMHIAAEL
jgi:UDP-galactopyranose mutase